MSVNQGVKNIKLLDIETCNCLHRDILTSSGDTLQVFVTFTKFAVFLGAWLIPRPYRRTGPHAGAILICRELLPLPHPKWVPFSADPSCLRLSSLSLADQVPSWSREPLNVVLAVECTGDPLCDQASVFSIHCISWQIGYLHTRQL